MLLRLPNLYVFSESFVRKGNFRCFCRTVPSNYIFQGRNLNFLLNYVLLLSQRFGHISVQGTVLEDELCGMGEHVICARWQCCACSDQLFCCCLACFGL